MNKLPNHPQIVTTFKNGNLQIHKQEVQYNDGHFHFMRTGNVVTCHWLTVVNLTAGALSVANIIPSGYRPKHDSHCTAICVVDEQITGHARISYHSNGSVKFLSSYTGIQEVHHCVSWITQDDMP